MNIPKNTINPPFTIFFKESSEDMKLYCNSCFLISFYKVLKDIFNYCALDGFVFFGVSFIKAKKILPNGKNAHATVKPPDWWSEKISKNNIANSKVYKYTLLKVSQIIVSPNGKQKKKDKIEARLF